MTYDLEDLENLEDCYFYCENVEVEGIGVAITTVVVGLFGGFVISIYLGSRMFSANSGLFKNMALKTVQDVNEGFVCVETSLFVLKGKEGIAQTVLRPGGKVLIEGEVYDAVAENGFIEKDEKILVKKVEATQLYVEILD